MAFKLEADNLVLDLEKRLGKVARRQSKENKEKSMRANYRTVRDLWRSSAETIKGDPSDTQSVINTYNEFTAKMTQNPKAKNIAG